MKTGPIGVSLPEKVIQELPKMISAEGCSLATGYGDLMASRYTNWLTRIRYSRASDSDMFK